MRRILLIAVVAFLMLWLSGCMVIDCEDYGPPAGVCVVPVHPHPWLRSSMSLVQGRVPSLSLSSSPFSPQTPIRRADAGLEAFCAAYRRNWLRFRIMPIMPSAVSLRLIQTSGLVQVSDSAHYAEIWLDAQRGEGLY
jgi:hypothetical protein